MQGSCVLSCCVLSLNPINPVCTIKNKLSTRKVETFWKSVCYLKHMSIQAVGLSLSLFHQLSWELSLPPKLSVAHSRCFWIWIFILAHPVQVVVVGGEDIVWSVWLHLEVTFSGNLLYPVVCFEEFVWFEAPRMEVVMCCTRCKPAGGRFVTLSWAELQFILRMFTDPTWTHTSSWATWFYTEKITHRHRLWFKDW